MAIFSALSGVMPRGSDNDVPGTFAGDSLGSGTATSGMIGGTGSSRWLNARRRLACFRHRWGRQCYNLAAFCAYLCSLACGRPGQTTSRI